MASSGLLPNAYFNRLNVNRLKVESLKVNKLDENKKHHEILRTHTVVNGPWEADGIEVIAYDTNHDPVHPANGFIINYLGRKVILSGDGGFGGIDKDFSYEYMENYPYTKVLKEVGQDCDLLVNEIESSDAINNFIIPAVEAGAKQLKPEDKEKALVTKQILLDTFTYHTSPKQVGQIATILNSKSLVLNHIVPYLPAAFIPQYFDNPVKAEYKGNFIEGEQFGTIVRLKGNSSELAEVYNKGAVGRPTIYELGNNAIDVALIGRSGPISGAENVCQSCTIVFVGEHALVIDCGSGALGKILNPLTGLAPMFYTKKISMLITHYHSDHITGLANFNLQHWIGGAKEPLTVYGGPGIERLVNGVNEMMYIDYIARKEHHPVISNGYDVYKLKSSIIVEPEHSENGPTHTHEHSHEHNTHSHEHNTHSH